MKLQDLTETQLRLIGRLALGLPNNIPLIYLEHKFTKGDFEQGKQLTNDIMRVWFKTHAPESLYWSSEQLWVMTVTQGRDVLISYPVGESLYDSHIYSQANIQNLFREWKLEEDTIFDNWKNER